MIKGVRVFEGGGERAPVDLTQHNFVLDAALERLALKAESLGIYRWQLKKVSAQHYLHR